MSFFFSLTLLCCLATTNRGEKIKETNRRGLKNDVCSNTFDKESEVHSFWESLDALVPASSQKSVNKQLRGRTVSQVNTVSSCESVLQFGFKNTPDEISLIFKKKKKLSSLNLKIIFWKKNKTI